MALTAKQKRALPASAFVYPSKRAYPVPTKTQARKAGISESQRQRTLSSAKAFSARRSTMGTPAKVRSVVKRRK